MRERTANRINKNKRQFSDYLQDVKRQLENNIFKIKRIKEEFVTEEERKFLIRYTKRLKKLERSEKNWRASNFDIGVPVNIEELGFGIIQTMGVSDTNDDINFQVNTLYDTTWTTLDKLNKIDDLNQAIFG